MLCMQFASNGIYTGLRFTHAMAVHSPFDPSRLAVRAYKPYFPKLWLSNGGSDASFPPDQVSVPLPKLLLCLMCRRLASADGISAALF